MDMPKPTAEHEKLTRLAGIWKGIETMHPSQWYPDGSKAEGTTRSRVALSGFGVVCDYEQRHGGQITFEGHGVYTWNPQRGQVVLYWFDSMRGTCEVFRGNWSGDRLTLESEGPMMGRMRLSYDFATEGKLGSKMECSQDGGKTWSTMFDAVYQRED